MQWSIDHIRPVSSFNLLDMHDLSMINHYTNLRPLEASANMKKRNKITDENRHLLKKYGIILNNKGVRIYE